MKGLNSARGEKVSPFDINGGRMMTEENVSNPIESAREIVLNEIPEAKRSTFNTIPDNASEDEGYNLNFKSS